MIVPSYFEDLSTLHLGTTPNRAYYIPTSPAGQAPVEHREQSDRFELLNGDWLFRYCPCVYDFEEHFYREDYEPAGWDTIPVPAVWQNHGYDHHQYTNVNFPFPADPPYVPVDNPCGAYLHHFTYFPDPDAPRSYLNFEGVDSCFYVWLNGQFVGYSQVTHATAEFDVSALLQPGDNTLAVLVLKWCDGSYMEDQDKFRTTGIIRDVYLLHRPQEHIRDYFVTTDLDGCVAVRLAYHQAPVSTQLTLLDHLGREVARGQTQPLRDGDYTHSCTLSVSRPILWDPERPYLYTLVLQTPHEVIRDRVGIRRIRVEDDLVLLNEQPIRFRGVNRHDSDPVTGPVISVEHMLRDLALIRQHNFNAIRTSHYPNSPVFLQLCDQFGFLVIDEADHESHGANCLFAGGKNTWDDRLLQWNQLLADRPEYIEPTLDRTRLCVQRDKNRPCVVIWSMGNESAYGCCFEEALAWTKAFDPSRLTHYESALYRKGDRAYDFSNLDLYSYMYPSMSTLQDYVDSDPDKPFLMCEYAHAMGNSPGDLEDYWQFIQAHPVMCGGFVWEWCDHAVYAGKAANGKDKYLYGGDHGEYPHFANFCMDGLVYPDRTPHTGLLEYKNVHRPARVESFDPETGRLVLVNHMDFMDLSHYLTLSWQLTCDGSVIDSGTIDALPSIPARSRGELTLPLTLPRAGRCFLKLTYLLRQAEPLRPAGFELGFDELSLPTADPANHSLPSVPAVPQGSRVQVAEEGRYVRLSGPDFDYRYDTLTGSFSRLRFRDRELLDRPMSFNLWRAPMDNDRKIKLIWTEHVRYHRTATRAYSTRVGQTADGVKICSTASISGMSVQRLVELELLWTVSPAGVITLDVRASRDPDFPPLPRFGLRLFLPNALEQAEYFGLGPMENYVDKRHAAWHGLFHTTVTQLHEDYLRPQENGAHGDCDFVRLSGDGLRLSVIGSQPFSFNASHYTQEELTEKRHSFELEECGSTVLCLDAGQSGCGSASCGPELLPQYALNASQLQLQLTLVPHDDRIAP